MELQAIDLRQLMMVRRIGSAQLGLQPLSGRDIEYVRQLSSNGDTYELSGLSDKATLDQLFGLSGTIWVTDSDWGNFHAVIEVSASWNAQDAPELEETV
jgi:hypothetical protein